MTLDLLAPNEPPDEWREFGKRILHRSPDAWRIAQAFAMGVAPDVFGDVASAHVAVEISAADLVAFHRTGTPCRFGRIIIRVRSGEHAPRKSAIARSVFVVTSKGSFTSRKRW